MSKDNIVKFPQPSIEELEWSDYARNDWRWTDILLIFALVLYGTIVLGGLGYAAYLVFVG